VNDKVTHQAADLFDGIFRTNRTLDNIKRVKTLLPTDQAVLREIASRCLRESRAAMRAGDHLEGRRFDILARQLHELAAKHIRSRGVNRE
jgi:hypothetical protein